MKQNRSSESPRCAFWVHSNRNFEESHRPLPMNIQSGFGGLEVACWPLVPKFGGLEVACWPLVPKFGGLEVACWPLVPKFGGLEVECWPLVPKFAGSHLAEDLAEKNSSARLPSEGK